VATTAGSGLSPGPCHKTCSANGKVAGPLAPRHSSITPTSRLMALVDRPQPGKPRGKA